MKRQNHEEVYTSSTRSSPRGKRLLSWLLSIVMLLSLLPGMELHVHAGYEDGAVLLDMGGQAPLRFEKAEVALVRLRVEF